MDYHVIRKACRIGDAPQLAKLLNSSNISRHSPPEPDAHSINDRLWQLESRLRLRIAFHTVQLKLRSLQNELPDKIPTDVSELTVIHQKIVQFNETTIQPLLAEIMTDDLSTPFKDSTIAAVLNGDADDLKMLVMKFLATPLEDTALSHTLLSEAAAITAKSVAEQLWDGAIALEYLATELKTGVTAGKSLLAQTKEEVTHAFDVASSELQRAIGGLLESEEQPHGH